MDIYEEIVKLRQEGRRGAVATIVNVRGSIPSFETAKMLVRDDGSIAGTIGGGCVEAEVWQAAREVMESEKPRSLTFNLNQDPKYDTGLVCGGTLDIFIEPVLPPALLYIFGAGHVSVNLYKVARGAGFEVTVVDDRETYASRDRFPEAKEVIAQDFEQAMAGLSPNQSSYIVIVTRGHRDDMRVLRWAVQTESRYIGMIGSKTQDDYDFPRADQRRHSGTTFRARTRARWFGYWRHYAGRDCSRDNRGADCRASPFRTSFATHELVQKPPARFEPNRSSSRGSAGRLA